MLQSQSHLKETSAPSIPVPRDRTMVMGLLLILGAFYGLLQNGYWYPGNSSEVYMALARNLANGREYLFNGMPVVKVAPGWPVVLAGLMKISGSFWFLNLVPMFCLLATAVMWYYILRRLTSQRIAFWAVLISAIAFPWYQLTTLLFSDAFFCLLSTAGLLLAFQINENKSGYWRIALLLLMCIVMGTIRFTGILSWIVIGGALVSGQWRPGLNRQWLTLVLSGGMACGAFFGTMNLMNSYAKEISKKQPKEKKTRLEDALSKTRPIVQSRIEETVPRNILFSGNWLSWLFWRPTEVGAANKALNMLTNVIGWLVLLAYLVFVGSNFKSRQWVWLAATLACAALVARWGRPVPRYLVPVLPLLLLGTWQGIECLGALGRRAAWEKAARALAYLFLGSVVLCNLMVWATDLWVARSADFYETYMAGQTKDLIAAADYVNQRGVADGQIAINEKYLNLNKQGNNTLALRVLNVLTDRRITVVPSSVTVEDELTVQMLKWARAKGVRYYVRRPPVNPWRLYHFRVPWLQETMTGQPVGQPNPLFELYELTDAGFVKIDLTEPARYPRKMPGLAG